MVQGHPDVVQCGSRTRNALGESWSRRSSLWLLDESSDFQDSWALRYIGVAFHEGIRKASGKANLVFRGSRFAGIWN